MQGYYTAIISLAKLGAQSWVTNTEDSHFVLLDVLTLTQFSGFVEIQATHISCYLSLIHGLAVFQVFALLARNQFAQKVISISLINGLLSNAVSFFL